MPQTTTVERAAVSTLIEKLIEDLDHDHVGLLRPINMGVKDQDAHIDRFKCPNSKVRRWYERQYAVRNLRYTTVCPACLAELDNEDPRRGRLAVGALYAAYGDLYYEKSLSPAELLARLTRARRHLKLAQLAGNADIGEVHRILTERVAQLDEQLSSNDDRANAISEAAFRVTFKLKRNSLHPGAGHAWSCDQIVQEATNKAWKTWVTAHNAGTDLDEVAKAALIEAHETIADREPETIKIDEIPDTIVGAPEVGDNPRKWVLDAWRRQAQQEATEIISRWPTELRAVLYSAKGGCDTTIVVLGPIGNELDFLAGKVPVIATVGSDVKILTVPTIVRDALALTMKTVTKMVKMPTKPQLCDLGRVLTDTQIQAAIGLWEPGSDGPHGDLVLAARTAQALTS